MNMTNGTSQHSIAALAAAHSQGDLPGSVSPAPGPVTLVDRIQAVLSGGPLPFARLSLLLHDATTPRVRHDRSVSAALYDLVRRGVVCRVDAGSGRVVPSKNARFALYALSSAIIGVGKHRSVRLRPPTEVHAGDALAVEPAVASGLPLVASSAPSSAPSKPPRMPVALFEALLDQRAQAAREIAAIDAFLAGWR